MVVKFVLEVALQFISQLTKSQYKAYLVGGFVRDYLLGIESNDIDITTNATPKEIREIFKDNCLPSEDYGSVTVVFKNIRFEVTTFRVESSYVDHRKPVEVKYIDDLYQDLLRRDFTINTICMNDKGEIIDYLAGQDDLSKKIIRTVGPAKERFREDALRILRAIRFATVFSFEFDDEVLEAISECKDLIFELSYYRKKQELDKIFASSHALEGIDLLLRLGLDKQLGLSRLKEVKSTNSVIGVWSVLDVLDKYPFTNNEKELIKSINEVMDLNNLDPMTLYKYGLYVNSVAGEIKGMDIREITEAYNNLIIQGRKDLAITSEEIMKLLDKEPGAYLTDIYEDIEGAVLYRRVRNEKEVLSNYIINHYNGERLV